MVLLSSNGQISGTLPANRSANATVTIRADDGCNPAVTETFTITVNVNQAPVITDPGDKIFETGKDIGKAIIGVRPRRLTLRLQMQTSRK